MQKLVIHLYKTFFATIHKTYTVIESGQFRGAEEENHTTLGSRLTRRRPKVVPPRTVPAMVPAQPKKKKLTSVPMLINTIRRFPFEPLKVALDNYAFMRHTCRLVCDWWHVRRNALHTVRDALQHLTTLRGSKTYSGGQRSRQRARAKGYS